jgi:hypothetical protein
VLVQRDAKDVIRRVDRIGRWVYPAALMVVILVALVL